LTGKNLPIFKKERQSFEVVELKDLLKKKNPVQRLGFSVD
jgi:hypothetical protein